MLHGIIILIIYGILYMLGVIGFLLVIREMFDMKYSDVIKKNKQKHQNQNAHPSN